MKQRKTMKVWQLIVILVLALALFITMFLPAFRIDGKAMGKIVRIVLEEIDTAKLPIGEEEIEEKIQEMEEKADEGIADYETAYNINFSRVSAWNIMCTDFLTFSFGFSPTEEQIKISQENETYLSIQKGYNLIKVFLWITYAFIFVIILLSILGFLLKWSKYISLIINTVYAVAVSALFGYLRFGLMGYIAGKVDDNNNLIKDMFGKLMGAIDISSISFSKILSCFYSIAFLMAFIVAIVFALANILFMFIGNRAANNSVEMSGEPYGFTPNFDNGFDFGTDKAFGDGGNPFLPSGGTGGGVFPGTDTQAKTESAYPIPEPKPLNPKLVNKPKPPAMGQVRCIKGIASGQGLMLPENRKIIVGKSPMKANLVITNPHISNVHCSIQYRAFSNTYIIKDHSTNGTYVNGVRLQNNAAMEFPAGTTVSFADGSDEIVLGN